MATPEAAPVRILPMAIGLDDGEKVSGLGAEEEDHESGAGAVGGIHFQTHRLAVIADAGHELHIALAWDVEAASEHDLSKSLHPGCETPLRPRAGCPPWSGAVRLRIPGRAVSLLGLLDGTARDEALEILNASAYDLGVFGIGAEVEVSLQVNEGRGVVL